MSITTKVIIHHCRRNEPGVNEYLLSTIEINVLFNHKCNFVGFEAHLRFLLACILVLSPLTKAIYTYTWKKYLPLIRLLLKRSASNPQSVKLDNMDFDKLRTKTKLAVSFKIEIEQDGC